MATASVGTKLYWYNGGWNETKVGGNTSTSGGAGSTGLYNGPKRTIIPVTVTPSTDYKITSVSLRIGLVGGSTKQSVYLYARAYNSLDNAKSNLDTGWPSTSVQLGKQGRVQATDVTNSGLMLTVTMSGFAITSKTTLYIALHTDPDKDGSTGWQIWTRATGNCSLPTASVSESINIPSLTVNSTNNAAITTSEETKEYRFTAPSSKTYVIRSSMQNTASYSNDPIVYLYNSSGTELGNSDDDGDDYNFRLAYNFESGKTYTFKINLYGYTTGTIPFKFGEVYSINYNKNTTDTVSDMPSNGTKDYGFNYYIPDVIPTRAGYTFKGWGSSSTSISAINGPPSMGYGGYYTGDEGYTYYAIWEKYIFAVTLDGHYSSVSDMTVYLQQNVGWYSNNTGTSSITKITPPTYTGFTFQGYYTESGGGGTRVIDSSGKFLTTSISQTTLYAYWTENNYTIKFNSNGGASDALLPSTMTGKAVYTIPKIVPYKIGYNFLGWATSATATTPNPVLDPGKNARFGKNTTIYAIWEEAPSISVGESKTISLLYQGQSIFYTFTPNSTTKKTIRFESSNKDTVDPYCYFYNKHSEQLDYNDDGAGSQNFLLQYALNQTLSGDEHYYIRATQFDWNKITNEKTGSYTLKAYEANYSLSYDLQGGSGAFTTHTGASSYTIRSGKPTKDGYTFTGWALNNDTSILYQPQQTVEGLLKNSTLYAQWVLNSYTLTLQSSTGIDTVTGAGSKVAGSSCTVTATPLPGYNFLSWSNTNGTVISTANPYTFTMPANNYTLRASGTPASYNVTFDGNGGTPTITSATVTYESSYGSLPSATRVGYIFQGWYTQISSGNKIISTSKVTSTQNHTLYAHWEPIKYIINYNNQPYTSVLDITKLEQELTYDTSVHLNTDMLERKHTITYNKNGGTDGPSDHTIIFDLIGWIDEQGNIYADGAQVLNLTQTNGDRLNFYPRWSTETVTLPSPTQKGYNFLGWYNSQGEKVGNGGDIYQPTNTITLYAHWDPVGLVQIYCDGKWQKAIPYIYTETGWKRALAHTYTEKDPDNPWEIGTNYGQNKLI